MTTTPRPLPVVAVFDLDGTITDCDTYVKFLKLCLLRQPSRISRSLHLPFAVLLQKFGRFDNTWLKETFLAALAAGYSIARLTELVNILVDDLLENHLRNGAVQAIQFHRESGHHLLLASASFDFYVNLIGAKLGFDDVLCTKAALGPGDTLLGKIQGKNCYGSAKVDAVLNAIPERSSCTLIAYSDHHSDWGLLSESDIPVAVNPTRKLRRLASAENVEVRMW